jgi:uncharacterized protein involved in exopolysaccharide biosynthesis
MPGPAWVMRASLPLEIDRAAARVFYNQTMAVYGDVKRALQEILAPQLGEIRGEMAALRSDMNTKFAEVEARFAKVDARFTELDSGLRLEVGQLRAEVRQEINNLHTDIVRLEQVLESRLQTIGMAERIARIEERLALKPVPAA